MYFFSSSCWTWRKKTFWQQFAKLPWNVLFKVDFPIFIRQIRWEYSLTLPVMLPLVFAQKVWQNLTDRLTATRLFSCHSCVWQLAEAEKDPSHHSNRDGRANFKKKKNKLLIWLKWAGFHIWIIQSVTTKRQNLQWLCELPASSSWKQLFVITDQELSHTISLY